ncbi:glycosyltransferase family 4 protein [Baekduia soli]|uniref:Glycosyltransferase family 4 protein n=1 Tax=Baekduia soli TaxID=496014 RepID=A0A5B8U2Y4_9ACTN|nr:glycosyltransferase family 4 protein [Baekduia soli]QEC47330.1 glycosyltransferase family 4 protein [Baekduia soli]
MRLAAYSDDPYARADGPVGAEMPFALFLAGLGDAADGLVLLGRVQPGHHEPLVALPDGLRFVELPWWEDLSRPAGMLRALPGSLRVFWRVAGEVDGVLLFGPSPLGVAFALLTRLRGRRLALGVRMDYVSYVTHRHPGRRSLAWIAGTLDAAWRLLARRTPTIVVGAGLAARYRRAPRLLEVWVSLVRDAQVHAPAREEPGATGPIRVLTVGRVDTEKNPLLLADILARLRAGGADWRLTVCGDGPLLGALRERAEALGVAEHLDLRGFVGPSDGLADLYRDADMFLHVSWTEGMPQVLVEAWAAGLPVVATDVGGVAAAVGSDGGLLVAPGDAGAASAALQRIAGDAGLRARLGAGSLRRAREHTLERETARIATFLAGSR